MSTNNNGQVSLNAELFTRQYWKLSLFEKQEFLAEIRTKTEMVHRLLENRVNMSRDNMSSVNRDKLEQLIEEMSQLKSLQDVVVTLWKEEAEKANPPQVEMTVIEEETNQSKIYLQNSEKILKVANTLCGKMNDKFEDVITRARRRDRRDSQDSQDDGQHHSDRPDRKVNLASDLRPETIELGAEVMEFESFKDKAMVYFEASNMKVTKPAVQLGYLSTLVHFQMWKCFKDLVDEEEENISQIDFVRGLELLTEVYYRNNDIFLLRLQCLSHKFRGKSAEELTSWYFDFRKRALNCGLFSLSEKEFLNLFLLREMPTEMQKELFLQSSKPVLEQTLLFLNNKSTVERLATNKHHLSKPSKSVNNVTSDMSSEGGPCWSCGGGHLRSQCTEDKSKLVCEGPRGCGKKGHVQSVCGKNRFQRDSSLENPKSSSDRSRGRDRSSRRRSKSASSSSSSSSSSSRERRRKKKAKKKNRERSKEKKSRKSRVKRKSSGTTSRSSASRSRSRSASTKPKKRGHTPHHKKNVNAVRGEGGHDTHITGVRMVHTSTCADPRASSTDCDMQLDSGTWFCLVDLSEIETRGWSFTRVHEFETPSLFNPDGSPLRVLGRISLWLRLPHERRKKRITFWVTPKLHSRFLVSLPAMRKLRWLSPDWPHDIGGEAAGGGASSSDSTEMVNVVNTVRYEDLKDFEKEERRRRRREEKRERKGGVKAARDEDLDEGDSPGFSLDDLIDVEDISHIPDFDSFPQWLQEEIVANKNIFANKMEKGAVMKVKPARFVLKKDMIPEDRPLTAVPPPVHFRAAADRILDEMLDCGLIFPAPRACKFKSKAIFIPKKSSPTEPRMIIDYKSSKVNDCILRPHHPQFTPEQLCQEIGPGMTHYFSIDVKNCYFTYPIVKGAEGSDVTCMLTHRGKYCLSVLPQGLRPSSDYVGETMDEMITSATEHGVPVLRMDRDRGGCIRLIDDVVGVAKSEKQAQTMIKALFQGCQKYGIKINPKKMQYSTEYVDFAGLRINKEGVQPGPDRLKAIKDFPRCKTPREVKRLLGLCNTLSMFTSTFLRSCKHLRSLVRKNVAFQWEKCHEDEFQYLTKTLSQAKLLHHFDTSLQVGLDIDSALEGVGMCLYNYDEKKGTPGKDNFKLIRCSSAAGKPSWKNYSPLELESTGVLLACRKMHNYIVGRPRVLIRNDHKSLADAYSNKDLSQCTPRLRRIFCELREYDVDIQYCKAEDLLHVDALSRSPVEDVQYLGPDPIDDKFKQAELGARPKQVVANVVDHEDLDYQVDDPLYADLFFHCHQDEFYQEAVRMAEQHHRNVQWKELPQGCMARQMRDQWPQVHVLTNSRGHKALAIGNTKFVIPRSYIPEVLKFVDVTHGGYPKAVGLARSKWWWPGFTRDIEQHCKSCTACNTFTPAYPEEPLAITPPQQIPSMPFQYLATDPFQWKEHHYLMVTDIFSKYSKYFKLSGYPTSARVIRMLSEFMLEHGYCELLASDGSQVFMSHEFQEWMQNNKMEHRLSSPLNSRSNGACEQKIGHWKSLKRKLEFEGKNTEADMRAAWELMQNLPTSPGALSPARLAFFRDRRHPALPVIPAHGGEAQAGRIAQKEKQEDKVRRNENISKFTRRPEKFVVGERVLVQHKDKKRGFCLPAKVIQIRPNTNDRSAVLQFPDGSTMIRNRAFCHRDLQQAQPNDAVNNIVQDEGMYLRIDNSGGDREHGRVVQVSLSHQLRSILKYGKNADGSAVVTSKNSRRVSFQEQIGEEVVDQEEPQQSHPLPALLPPGELTDSSDLPSEDEAEQFFDNNSSDSSGFVSGEE